MGACAGEALVSYRGAVVAGPEAAYSFDDARNPAGLPPVPGAVVDLLVCPGECRGGEAVQTVIAGDDGAWGPLERVFGALAGNHEIQIRVTAPGYRPFAYSAIYETTADPSGGEAFLNVVLAPG